MNRKLIVRILIVFVISLIVGYFYSYVKKDYKVYDSSITNEELTIGEMLYEGQTYEYTFTCDKDELTGIRFYFSADEDLEGSLVYTLIDEYGNQLQSASIKNADLRAGLFTSLDLDEIDNSEGETYTIVLSCQNSMEKAVGLYMVPTDDDSDATVAAMEYTCRIWDIETMIVFQLCIIYLMAFVLTLVKIFRK